MKIMTALSAKHAALALAATAQTPTMVAVVLVVSVGSQLGRHLSQLRAAKPFG
jgi:hypothetical protein